CQQRAPLGTPGAYGRTGRDRTLIACAPPARSPYRAIDRPSPLEESRVAFMGETEEVGVAELLSVLASRRHSGRLSITAEGEEIQIFLAHGKVVLVSSSNHALRLGRVLVRLGFVTAAQLDAAVREQDLPGSGRPLGQILVDAGWISREQLAK